MDVETLTQLGRHFDSQVKGSELNGNTAGLETRELDKFVAEKNQENGKGEFRTKESSNGHKVPVNEEDQNLKNVIGEKESISHQSSEKNSESAIRRENEISELEHVKFSKLEVAEFDVERVLEEQDTHDLYCPNCNAHITKRVILRKRKRIVPESQYDLPPEKVRRDQGTTPAPAELPELVAEDKDFFTCLSCFSIFNLKEAGFNIFRWTRDKTKNFQSSQKAHATSDNNSFSKEEDSEAVLDASLLVESYTTPTNDSSTEAIQGYPDQTVVVAAEPGENRTATGKEDAEAGFNIFRWKRDKTKNLRSSQQAHVTGDNKALKKETSKEEDSEAVLDASLLVESDTTPTKDSSPEAIQRYPDQTVVVAAEPGKNRTATGKEDAGSGTDVSVVKVGLLFPDINSEIHIGDGPSHQGVSPSNEDVNGSKPADAIVLPHYDIIKPDGMVKPAFLTPSTPSSQIIRGSVPQPSVDTRIPMDEPSVETRPNNDWDVLKSIVYGGLTESITSLGIVSSAAGADTSTLNICALGLANLIGGLFVIAHSLVELRSIQGPEISSQGIERTGRYWEQLGKRENFRRHAIVSILSYILFGLLPPIVYGFSFLQSDNKEYKLIAVAAASLLCIALLAIGKAHVKPNKDYIKTLSYYLGLGVSASGLSYAAGMMFDKLLVELGLFDHSTASPSPPSSIKLLGSGVPAWASF